VAGDLLVRLAGCAAPGAVLLGQTIDPYTSTDPVHLAYHQRNRDRGRRGGQLRIRVRFQNLATEWFDYWFLTVDELTQVVEPTPWTLTDVTRSRTGYLTRLSLDRLTDC